MAISLIQGLVLYKGNLYLRKDASEMEIYKFHCEDKNRRESS